MPWTTTIDAKTGKTKSFWLDASFGCKKRIQKSVNATRTHPVWEVRWSNTRTGPLDQCRKFTFREDAESFFFSKKRKKQRPEFVYHTSGVHDIAY